MKNHFIITIICISLMSISCSKAQEISLQRGSIAEEQKGSLKTTAEDQIIVDKFMSLVKGLGTSENETVKIELRELLPEVSRIKNKRDRERIQMNLYISLKMYEEANALNEKQLAEKPTTEKQFRKCQYMEILNRTQDEIKSCNEQLAQHLHKDLNVAPKDDPQYPYGEWAYLLAMYKAGHSEYKQKMEAFIASTTDERMKSEFQDSYELATGQ